MGEGAGEGGCKSIPFVIVCCGFGVGMRVVGNGVGLIVGLIVGALHVTAASQLHALIVESNISPAAQETFEATAPLTHCKYSLHSVMAT